jgi:hypothetical protein
MNESREHYLAMAAYIRKHGFSPDVGEPGGCGCFLRASEQVNKDVHPATLSTEIVHDFSESCLELDGWTKRDAIAACEIAADLVTP